MVYEKKFPQCPYKGRGNNNCSHKGCPKHCIYVECPEKCEKYRLWLSSRKDDSDCVETCENDTSEAMNSPTTKLNLYGK